MIFDQILYFSEKWSGRERVLLNMLTTLMRQKEGLEIADIGWQRVGGFAEMLTLADKLGSGVGVWTYPFLADIVCEQPLIAS